MRRWCRRLFVAAFFFLALFAFNLQPNTFSKNIIKIVNIIVLKRYSGMYPWNLFIVVVVVFAFCSTRCICYIQFPLAASLPLSCECVWVFVCVVVCLERDADPFCIDIFLCVCVSFFMHFCYFLRRLAHVCMHLFYFSFVLSTSFQRSLHYCALGLNLCSG